MAMVVQSRFAGLKVEDDEPVPADRSNRANNAPKKADSKKAAKNNKSQQQQSNGVSKKKKKPVVVTEAQWEQWKQKDEAIVVEAYEDELEQAILLSKLDFEEKKDVYKQISKQTEAERKASELAAKEQSKSGQKKQKKKNVMSLNQFNAMGGGDEPKRLEEQNTEPPEEVKPDTEFFERVHDEAQNELRKDKHIDIVKQRQPVSNEVITRVQFAEALERKEKVVVELTNEVTRLKDELLKVKSRNKKLCNILGHGEMKDKAEVLIEVERLRASHGELTAEVAFLHTELEKARSAHPDTKNRDKRKKSTSDKDK